MKLVRLSMGCLPSRSAIVPEDRAASDGDTRKLNHANNKTTASSAAIRSNGTLGGGLNQGKSSSDNGQAGLANGRLSGAMMMSSSRSTDNIQQQQQQQNKSLTNSTTMPSKLADRTAAMDADISGSSSPTDDMNDGGGPRGGAGQKGRRSNEITTPKRSLSSDQQSGGGADDESPDLKADTGNTDLDMDLLRQYVAIDYEITNLENRDALRVYHEKIEQLEQLERELDMISAEADEIASRGASDSARAGLRSPNIEAGNVTPLDSKLDSDMNSLLSGATGSMSPRSWLGPQTTPSQTTKGNNKGRASQQSKSRMTFFKKNPAPIISDSAGAGAGGGGAAGSGGGGGGAGQRGSQTNLMIAQSTSSNANMPYSTIEEVFNRKIILEKERDRLKKEVEIVILECDRLQQRYKKRDDILDKLFDGRTGNGLENHLEQQLNWLLEQKHYVDQVFYAWKRAETLTSQTCEQFASALEILKRLSKSQDDSEKIELAKNIETLLIKSRQDMEQAQRYNPNVDAPFFTENESERFDKIVETISAPDRINSSELSQIMIVIQFAHKRAVSIRLWLEQILQTTIARDSFELAEEYKWIAIQLRKERVNLIRTKLQQSPYNAMAQQVYEQMSQQQQQVVSLPGDNTGSLPSKQQQRLINHQSGSRNQGQTSNNGQLQRGSPMPGATPLALPPPPPPSTQQQQTDSGVESEVNDMDIEEEIYRLLEMNKSRLEATTTTTANGSHNLEANSAGQRQSSTGGGGGRLATATAAAAATLQADGLPEQLKPDQQQQLKAAMMQQSQHQQQDVRVSRDQLMRDRIEKRVRRANSMASAIQMATPSSSSSTAVAALRMPTPSGTSPALGSLLNNGPSSGIASASGMNDANAYGDATTIDGRISVASNASQVASMPRTGALERQSGNQETTTTGETSGLASTSATSTGSAFTPTKLRISLDEEARRSLLKQVDQIHSKHRNNIEKIRGSNKAKAATLILDRLQQARQQQQQLRSDNVASNSDNSV